MEATNKSGSVCLDSFDSITSFGNDITRVVDGLEDVSEGSNVSRELACLFSDFSRFFINRGQNEYLRKARTQDIICIIEDSLAENLETKKYFKKGDVSRAYQKAADMILAFRIHQSQLTANPLYQFFSELHDIVSCYAKACENE